jgi:hypothetical protein
VHTYLVERYWPGVTSELLLVALNRGLLVMEQMRMEGTPIRDVTSILIPAEEVVFSVYEGPSADAILRLNERASIPVSRIVEAIAVTGDRGSLARAEQMPWALSTITRDYMIPTRQSVYINSIGYIRLAYYSNEEMVTYSADHWAVYLTLTESETKQLENAEDLDDNRIRQPDCRSRRPPGLRDSTRRPRLASHPAWVAGATSGHATDRSHH